MINDPGLRHKFGEDTYRLVKNEYDASRNANRLLDLLKETSVEVKIQ